jgi:hypothetical protein
MDFLFSIFEFLTLGAGPFFVFAGMGTGTQSGKLKFKNISPSADGSTSITENSDHIVVSSNISSSSAPSCEVLWGTGTSFTSGFLRVDNTNRSIVNIKHIGSSGEVSNSKNDGYRSLLLKACKSGIYINVNNSNAISTCIAKLCTTNESNIISSIDSTIDGDSYNSRANTIIGSYGSCTMGYSEYSTILSSYGRNCRQKLGSIISSLVSCNITQYQSCGNSILSSCAAQIIGCKTNFNSIISSTSDNYISHFNPLANGANHNFIGASRGSAIKGGQVKYGITTGSQNSSILGSVESSIKDAKFSSIIGSCGSKICFYRFYGKNDSPFNDYNSIIGSRNSMISTCNTDEYYGYSTSCTNTIISSKDSKDYSSCNTAIISSIGSVILKRSSASAIVSSCNSTLYYSQYSSIVSSAGSNISCSKSSVVLSGRGNEIRSGSNYSAIINGCLNRISFSYNAVILTGTCNKIGVNSKGASCNSVIIAGCKNYIKAVAIFGNCISNSSIIGGYCNTMCDAPHSSQILGGSCNSIGTILTSTIIDSSVIIAGCKNVLASGSNRNNVIIGGCNNSNFNSPFCNSVIIASYNSNMGGVVKSSALIGTTNVSYLSNDIYLTRVENFIFDRCVIVGKMGGPPNYGQTTTLNPSTTSFNIRRGFVTD